MDDTHFEEYGGFPLSRIMLSDVLPATLFDPGEKEPHSGGHFDQTEGTE